jgi:hypothetical protein
MLKQYTCNLNGGFDGSATFNIDTNIFDQTAARTLLEKLGFDYTKENALEHSLKCCSMLIIKMATLIESNDTMIIEKELDASFDWNIKDWFNGNKGMVLLEVSGYNWDIDCLEIKEEDDQTC